MAKAHLAILGNRTGDTEGLEPCPQGPGNIYGVDLALFQGNGGPQNVRPASVLETEGLDAFDNVIDIRALALAHGPRLLQGSNAVLLEDAVDLLYSAFVSFKKCHDRLLTHAV